MNTVLLVVAAWVALLIGGTLVRVAKGPTFFDRALGGSVVSANGVVLLLLIGRLYERIDLFVDIAIAYAMLTFVLPIALGRYFERGGEG